MSVNYPVGDFLIRLKNAGASGNKNVSIRQTNFIKQVAKALQREGYIDEMNVKDNLLEIRLRFNRKLPVLTNVQLISKPGLRVYLTREEIEEALRQFRGLIRQIPPLFSALKQEGLPLYKWARAGKTPQLREREAMIHTLTLKEVSLPLITLEVTCGRGTYIRSLCADLGRALGCGAHVVELRRYRSGKFSLDRALSVEDLARLTEQGLVRKQILPLKEAVDIQRFIRVEEKTAALIRQGRPLRPSDLPEEEGGWLKRRGRVGLLDGPDHLLAIGESMGSEGISSTKDLPVLRILRVFNN